MAQHARGAVHKVHPMFSVDKAACSLSARYKIEFSFKLYVAPGQWVHCDKCVFQSPEYCCAVHGSKAELFRYYEPANAVDFLCSVGQAGDGS